MATVRKKSDKESGQQLLICGLSCWCSCPRPVPACLCTAATGSSRNRSRNRGLYQKPATGSLKLLGGLLVQKVPESVELLQGLGLEADPLM